MEGRFAGMGADVGAPPGPVAVPNFAKKPAIIGVAIVIVLVVGFALLRSPGTESTSSTSGSGTEKKAVPDTAGRLEKAAQKLKRDRERIEALKQELADTKEQAAAVAAELNSAKMALKLCREGSKTATAEAALVATPSASAPAPAATTAAAAAAASSTVEAATTAVAAPSQDAVATCAAKLKSVSDELLSCNTRVETLGAEARQLQQRLRSASRVQSELDAAKAELLAQSKKMDKDAMKLIDVGQSASETGVKQAVNAVKDDLIKESVKVEGVVDRLSAAKDALQQNVGAVRDAAIKLERDIAQPPQSPADEKAKLAKEEKQLQQQQQQQEQQQQKTPNAEATAVEAVPSKEAVKRVEVGLLSTDDGTKVRAAEQLRAMAGQLGDAAAAVRDRAQNAAVAEVELALRERFAGQHRQAADAQLVARAAQLERNERILDAKISGMAVAPAVAVAATAEVTSAEATTKATSAEGRATTEVVAVARTTESRVAAAATTVADASPRVVATTEAVAVAVVTTEAPAVAAVDAQLSALSRAQVQRERAFVMERERNRAKQPGAPREGQ